MRPRCEHGQLSAGGDGVPIGRLRRLRDEDAIKDVHCELYLGCLDRLERLQLSRHLRLLGGPVLYGSRHGRYDVQANCLHARSSPCRMHVGDHQRVRRDQAAFYDEVPVSRMVCTK